MSDDNFHRYRVDRIVDESEIIKSFYLVAEDGAPLPEFLPGQFLTFKFTLPDQEQPIIRNYSLSSSSVNPQFYRISVKREPAPPNQSNLPEGLVSNYLHDSIKVGDCLVGSHPGGQFHLDTESDRPVVLLSGGVGVTPMISILHKLAAQGSRRVIYIHACENENVQAFKSEVQTLAENSSNITLHHCYREFGGQATNISQGLVDKNLLQQLLILDDYEFYLCGPPPFMSVMYKLIRELGVSAERIAYEFFGPATVLEKEFDTTVHAGEQTVTAHKEEKQSESQELTDQAIQVYFKNTGLTVSWDDQHDSILEFAEANGLEPDFSCRAGICSTCHCGMPEGEVEYIDDPLEMPEQGYVLPCISKPKSSIVIDL